jgi:hypothetical protein
LLFVLAFAPIQAVPVPATIRLAVPLALAWPLTACPSWPAWEGCADAVDCSSTSTGGSSGEATVPTMGGGFQTVTGSDESTSPSSSDAAPETGTSGTSGGEAIEPPAIVTVALNPDPIHVNGLIAATVAAEFADGVRMKLDTGEVRELALIEPGVFGGEIAVLTGLDNGTHPVWLTPWRAAVEGVVVEADYFVDLPEPGTQVFWEIDDSIGPGQVEALGTCCPTAMSSSSGPISSERRVALLSPAPRPDGRCCGPNAFEAVLPDSDCAAVDLKVDASSARCSCSSIARAPTGCSGGWRRSPPGDSARPSSAQA